MEIVFGALVSLKSTIRWFCLEDKLRQWETMNACSEYVCLCLVLVYLGHVVTSLLKNTHSNWCTIVKRQHLVTWLNTLRPRQRIFLNENVIISIWISLKFVPKGPINNIPALVQIMAWRRTGNKPLSEAMMASLLTHICITRSQRVNRWIPAKNMS